MSEQKSKDILEAEALIAKHRAAWNDIQKATRDYEEKYWNDNKDSLQAQGYLYTKNPESPWGGVWTKQVMPQSPAVAQTATRQKSSSQTNANNVTTNMVTTKGGLQMTQQELDFWTKVAQEKGFADVDAVAKWQSDNGLPADGKFGENSLTKYNAIAQANQQAAAINRPVATTKQPVATTSKQNPKVNPSTSTTKAPSRGMTLNAFRSHKNFRNHYGYNSGATVTIDGKSYPIMVSTGTYNPGSRDRFNDHTYALDEETGMVRAVDENWMGIPTNKWKDGANWIYWDESVGVKKQGGTMNRVKYFQQGGPAPQQDIQQQVIQLVQAAMSGDEKATQTVNQIMEAAKAGDKQAAQIAQMIQQVAQQIQGQATTAKWGAKLGYIRSLKFAKGGKTCPACEKKVEMKACGGKKAPRKDGGGWLELLPIYGTVQSGKRFFKNPSWKAAGEFGLDLLGDAAILTGVGAGVGAATKAIKATKAAKAVSNTASARKTYKTAKSITNQYPSRIVTTGSPAQQAALDAQRLNAIPPEHRQIINFVEQGNSYVGSGVGAAVPAKIMDVWNGGELPQK